MTVDYTQPPLAYLVRIPQADQDSLLHGQGIRLAEDAARFLSFERIGAVVCSAAAAAVETAETIAGACGVQTQVDERLADGIGAYLAAAAAGDGPVVFVCDSFALRAGLAAANVSSEEELVGPGGIVSLHQNAGEGACGPGSLVAIARHMILDWKFADLIAMIADNAGS